MRVGGVPAALLTVILTSACNGGSQPTLQTPSPPSPTSASVGPTTPAPSGSSGAVQTPVSSPSVDPKAQPAIDAYLAFFTKSRVATEKPVGLGQSLSTDADFTKYSFDPIRAQFVSYVAALAQQKQAFRGQPPEPRVSVKSIALDALP